jgi:hypothetical protein
LDNWKGRDILEDYAYIIGKSVLEWFLEKQSGKLWIGFIWLRIGTSGRLW